MPHLRGLYTPPIHVKNNIKITIFFALLKITIGPTSGLYVQMYSIFEIYHIP